MRGPCGVPRFFVGHLVKFKRDVRGGRTNPFSPPSETIMAGKYFKLNCWPSSTAPPSRQPSHIHFCVFERGFTERLVSQMYFPGDPLMEYDPIFLGIPDKKGRDRLVSRFDLSITQPEWALGYRFDIVVGSEKATPMEENHG